MKKIEYLKKGEKIFLVAPSFGCAEDPYLSRLEESIKNLKEDGFIIEEGPNTRLAKHKLRSNSAKKCAKEFNEAYLNSDAKVIMSVRGGEVMCEILPYIDFEAIKKAPSKIFCGFSDNANLTYTLTTICDLKTVYGTNGPGFYIKPYQYDSLDTLRMLQGETEFKGYPVWQRYSIKSENPLEVPNYSEVKKLRLYPNKDVDIEGRLLGGCLDLLINLCGTRFDKTKEYLERYKEDGFIWFLEACDLKPLDLERALFSLKEAGWFKYCKGFIMGRPLCYNQRQMGITHIYAIKEHLKSLKVPLILDADLGHFKPSMPIMTGAKARVKTKEGNLFISYLDD